MLLLCTYFKSSSPSHTNKNTLFLFFFSFSLSKGHSLGFEIRKKNLGYQNPKISLLCPSSSSKSAFETSHFISRRKEGQRANTPGFLSRPPTRSTPFLTAETLVRRDSSNSFPLLLLLFFVPGGRSLWWWSFSKSSSSVSKVWPLFVSGAISLFNLSREKKI